MPLIGSMDSQRARQVTEVALMGVKDRGARVVILDVTGMSTIDTATADKLIRCAKGLRLLGAETIISGIQPMVARVLVELGIDFKLATCQSLHDALAHALTLTDEFEQLRGRSRLL